MKRKALVIAPQPFFSPRGTPFSVYYRTLITAELGVKIDLLTYGQGQDVDIPGVRIKRIPNFPFWGNVKIGPSFLKLFLDVLLFFKTIGLLLVSRYHFVQAHEEAIFWGMFLKPIFRFKLVYDMHSSLPEQISNFNYSKNRLLIKLFTILEEKALQKADVIITICPDLEEQVRGRCSNHDKIFLIENSIFDPVRLKSTAETENNQNEYAFEFDIHNKYILYAGTLEPYQGIDLMIQSMAIVIKKIPSAVLVIAGGQPRQVQLYRKIAKEHGLEKVCKFTGFLDKKDVIKLIERADVVLSPRIKGNNTPLKIYELLSIGKPIVATKIRSHTQVLDETCAFLTDPDAESFAEGIIEALSSKELVEQKTRRARQLYEQNYSRATYIKKMKQWLERLN